LIMGLTPDDKGLLPQPDVERLKEWGDEIKRRFGTPLAKTSGKGKRVTLKLEKTETINHFSIQEDIAKGERVREFKVEGKTGTGWQVLFEGTAIGHKMIHTFDDVKVSQIRLVINEAKEEPIIKNFEVYNVQRKN